MILRLVAVALVLTGVAGCLPVARPSSESTPPPPLPQPLPKESHPPAERPVDRDQGLSLHYAGELEPSDFHKIEQVGGKRIGITTSEGSAG